MLQLESAFLVRALNRSAKHQLSKRAPARKKGTLRMRGERGAGVVVMDLEEAEVSEEVHCGEAGCKERGAVSWVRWCRKTYFIDHQRENTFSFAQ